MFLSFSISVNGLIRFEQRWSNKQLQKLLDTEHIRQHLIEVGLVCRQKFDKCDRSKRKIFHSLKQIDRFGDIVSKEEYERLRKQQSRRRRRPRTSSKLVDRRPSTVIDRHRHTSTSPSKQVNPSLVFSCSQHYFYPLQRNKSPVYLSSPHPSIRTKSISVQRTNPPAQVITIDFIYKSFNDLSRFRSWKTITTIDVQ